MIYVFVSYFPPIQYRTDPNAIDVGLGAACTPVPTDPFTPIPVGLLACQRDPLLRDLATTVVSSAVFESLPATTTKKTKKAVLAPSIPSVPILEVTLHDTVIFPEGGGQPSDIGTITTPAGELWDVVQAKRRGGTAIHLVSVPDGDVARATKSFSPGALVTVALGEAGFSRRYDHMTMHTSQHMLSALLETRLNLPTLSWSMTAYPTPSYVEIPRGMSIDEISTIQDEANKLVFEGREVHVEVDDLKKENEVAVAALPSGRSVGKALPDDYTGGVKRVIVIEGVDRNPCCGTHLPSLHNLQIFLLPHTDALSRSATTSARLYFLAGPRLIAHLTSTHSSLSRTAASLSCGAPLVPERVDQMIDEWKKAEKRVQEVEDELASLIADRLVREVSEVEEDALFRRHIHRTDDSTTTLAFLSTIASAFSKAVSAKRSYVVVLSSSPSSQSASSTTVVLIFGSDDKMVKEVGDGLKLKMNVKGGGKGQKWSGKFVGVWKEGREDIVVDDVVQSVVRFQGV